MPKSSNGRLPALGYPLITLSPDYLPSKSAVLRHLFYLRSINSSYHGLNDDIEIVYHSVKSAYDHSNILIREKHKVQKKISDLFKDYDEKICKNINNKHFPAYQQFKSSLREIFDVKLTPKPSQKQPPKSNNQFATVSWEDIVISSSEEEDDEDKEVIELEFREVVDCAKDLLSEELKNDPDYCVQLRSKLSERVRKKILSDRVLSCLDRVRMSSNSAFRLIASVLNELEIDIHNVIFSVSTISRHRKRTRTDHLEGLQQSIVFPEHLTLHWDGVKIWDLNLKKFVHHVAVKVTGVHCEQTLHIARTEDGTARTFVPIIIQQLREWTIFDRVHFLNFDTTRVNTGNNCY